jgi:hypothetical protein
MSVWDAVLLAVVAFVAVTSLVRLMIARRNELLAELRQQTPEAHPSSEEGAAKAP